MDIQSYFNTLTGIVKGLEKKYTIVDLRNESTVTGKIISVDGQMNIEMEDAIYYDSRGYEHFFPSFFVSKRNVRYVHIPKDHSAVELMGYQINRMRLTPKPKAKRTFKTVRATRYNKEITQAAYSQQEQQQEKPSESEAK